MQPLSSSRLWAFDVEASGMGLRTSVSLLQQRQAQGEAEGLTVQAMRRQGLADCSQNAHLRGSAQS